MVSGGVISQHVICGRSYKFTPSKLVQLVAQCNNPFNKSELLVMSKRTKHNRIFQPIKLAGSEVHAQDCANCLGIIFDKRLNFRLHIKRVIQKAIYLMRLLYPLMINQSLNWIKKTNVHRCCGSLLELLSRVEITVFDVCESFLLNKRALVAQINDLHF